MPSSRLSAVGWRWRRSSANRDEPISVAGAEAVTTRPSSGDAVVGPASPSPSRRARCGSRSTFQGLNSRRETSWSVELQVEPGVVVRRRPRLGLLIHRPGVPLAGSDGCVCDDGHSQQGDEPGERPPGNDVVAARSSEMKNFAKPLRAAWNTMTIGRAARVLLQSHENHRARQYVDPNSANGCSPWFVTSSGRCQGSHTSPTSKAATNAVRPAAVDAEEPAPTQLLEEPDDDNRYQKACDDLEHVARLPLRSLCRRDHRGAERRRRTPTARRAPRRTIQDPPASAQAGAADRTAPVDRRPVTQQ